ncbi:MAG: ABC transporter ATP-binding protein [Leptolyngbya sp. RL_3_1]|nr:ABC transporter ATP-binding protein [Leptolyngbya sp. RL_3_1]
MLTIQNLSKTYGSYTALNGLNLQIQPGEVYGLLGPNGAGKTTTINVICGLLRADQGIVWINDHPAGAATKPWVGVMPQANLLYRSLSCEENVAFFCQALRATPAAAIAAGAGLSGGGQPPGAGKNPGGKAERRHAASPESAIAMVHHPKLLILDEPTTGLDLEARHDVWELIRHLTRQEGMTILLTTHLLDEVERLCHRIGIIKQGQLLVEGTLAGLRRCIPAEEIVTVETAVPEAAIERGRACGFTPRRYGSDLAFWVPEQLDLKALLDRFDGIPIDSIARHPVGLEHIYLEATQPQKGESGVEG